jgi:hypothetical protein
MQKARNSVSLSWMKFYSLRGLRLCYTKGHKEMKKIRDNKTQHPEFWEYTEALHCFSRASCFASALEAFRVLQPFGFLGGYSNWAPFCFSRDLLTKYEIAPTSIATTSTAMSISKGALALLAIDKDPSSWFECMAIPQMPEQISSWLIRILLEGKSGYRIAQTIKAIIGP